MKWVLLLSIGLVCSVALVLDNDDSESWGDSYSEDSDVEEDVDSGSDSDSMLDDVDSSDKPRLSLKQRLQNAKDLREDLKITVSVLKGLNSEFPVFKGLSKTFWHGHIPKCVKEGTHTDLEWYDMWEEAEADAFKYVQDLHEFEALDTIREKIEYVVKHHAEITQSIQKAKEMYGHIDPYVKDLRQTLKDCRQYDLYQRLDIFLKEVADVFDEYHLLIKEAKDTATSYVAKLRKLLSLSGAEHTLEHLWQKAKEMFQKGTKRAIEDIKRDLEAVEAAAEAKVLKLEKVVKELKEVYALGKDMYTLHSQADELYEEQSKLQALQLKKHSQLEKKIQKNWYLIGVDVGRLVKVLVPDSKINKGDTK